MPLVLFHYGSYFWFFGDEWSFLGDRDGGSLHGLFDSHGEHWTTLPVVVYRVLFRVFGMHSYRPYQAVVVVAHVVTALLLRAVARRAGVRPWPATIVVGVFVLFAPGAQNILWAFQMTFVGAWMFGLAHLILADHDGEFGRRDLAGLAAGLAGLMCSGVSLVMVAVVALAVFLRRGWRMALAHAGPLAVVYAIWYAAMDPGGLANSYNRGPTPRELARFVWDGLRGTFAGLGAGVDIIGIAVFIVFVVGVVLAVRRHGPTWRTELAAPLALALGAPAFLIGSGRTRWFLSTHPGSQGRYVYTCAAFLLPLLAVAVGDLVSRWRVVTPLFYGLFVVAAFVNVQDFSSNPFGSAQAHRHEKALMTALASSGEARDAPAYLRPHSWVTVGWLRQTARDGDLPRPKTVAKSLQREIRNLLTIGQIDDDHTATDCRSVDRSAVLTWRQGQRFSVHFDGPPRTVSYFTQDMVVIERLKKNGAVLGRLNFKTEFGDGIEVVERKSRVRVYAADAGHDVLLCAVETVRP